MQEQLTCVQNVRFIFDFFEKREWLPEEASPVSRIAGQDKIEPESVRNLGSFLSHRLSRIAAMMEILQAACQDWVMTGERNRIVMETEAFDFNDALAVLKDRGFHDDEYVLEVEYKRKWGML